MQLPFYRLILAVLLLVPATAFADTIYFPAGTGTGEGLGTFGPISITGRATDGSDQINNVSVNGVANVKAYGAKGNVTADWGGSCSLPANSNLLTCTAGAFQPTDVGKTIFVPDFIGVTVTGAVNNGSGAIRLTVSSTAGLNTATVAVVRSIQLGTVEANGVWNFTVIDGTHIDLTGSTFTNAWIALAPPWQTPTLFNLAAPTLDTTITHFISNTQVQIGASRTVAATGQTALWATDDTAAIQKAYNDRTSGTLFFPPGNYLNRGQNWVCGHNPQGGCKNLIYGTAWGGGSNIFSVGVTNPGGTPGATKVGIQHANYMDKIRDLCFWGGFWGAPDTAPAINFLSARVGDAGTDFDIDHQFSGLTFNDTGINGNNVVLYGAEQAHFYSSQFQNGYASKSVLNLSPCNTQGWIAPYAALVAAPTSTTFIGLSGRDTSISGWDAGNQNAGGLVVFDNACDPWPIYSISLDDIYTNQGASTFLRDTYTGNDTVPRSRFIHLRDFYSEAMTTIDQATNIHTLAESWDIQGQFYAFAGLNAGYTPWQFGLGFIHSKLKADTTGHAAGTNSIFDAQTCSGSSFNLTQSAGITGCNDWLYSTGYNQPYGANQGGDIQSEALAVVHQGNEITAGFPQVSAGATLFDGSRDSFGEVEAAPTLSAVTLTFATAWRSTPACILTDDGQGMLWYAANKSPSSVDFVCIRPTTGAACDGGEIVSYHCAAIGTP